MPCDAPNLDVSQPVHHGQPLAERAEPQRAPRLIRWGCSAQSTFGNVNADLPEYFDPSFVRDNRVDIIRNNCWPE